jgi:hypothetical protein
MKLTMSTSRGMSYLCELNRLETCGMVRYRGRPLCHNERHHLFHVYAAPERACAKNAGIKYIRRLVVARWGSSQSRDQYSTQQ